MLTTVKIADYIMHLIYVMHRVKPLGEIAMICAVLHNFIEDKEEGTILKFYKKNGFLEGEEAEITKKIYDREEKEKYFHPV